METPDLSGIDIPVLGVTDIVNYWPQLLSTLIILIVTLLLNAAIRWLFAKDNRWLDRDADGFRTPFAVKGSLLAPLALWAIAWFATLNVVWGANWTIVVASLSPVFLGVGFALRSVISNFFGGLISLFDGAYSEGNLIQVGNDIGFVTGIGWFSTTIQTHSKAVDVPNDVLKSSEIINYSKKPGFRDSVIVAWDDARWGDLSLTDSQRVTADSIQAICDRLLGTGKFDVSHDRKGVPLERPEKADWSFESIHSDAITAEFRIWATDPLSWIKVRHQFLLDFMTLMDQEGISYGYTTYLGSKAGFVLKKPTDDFLAEYR